MEIYCTRPGCPRPRNYFSDIDEPARLKTVQQKFCTTCGMPLILDNRYVATKLLGKGGFGAAFLALDRRTPNLRACVVKQFQPAASLTPDQLRTAQGLFEREAEVLEKLGNRHDQIPDLMAFFPLDVPGLATGQADQFFYIVQEFVDGINMEDELEQRGPFSEAEVLEILTEMLKILQFVHENGTIHRDIKPSNIMRHRDGRLFLLDFGAVKQVTTTAGQPARSATGIYTEGFAPPEQRHGKEVYPSTDLYALAVTCLMLLTGKQPDELHDAFTNTWSWRAYVQVSDRLEAVLNRMLRPTPSERFATAQEALAALQVQPPSSPGSLQPPPPLPPPVPQPPSQPSAQSPTQLPVQPSAPPAQPVSGTSAQKPLAPKPPLGQPPAQSPTQVQSAPPGPSNPAPVKSPAALAPRPAFSLVEVLSGAAFTGFQGGLLAIAVASLVGTATLSPLFWLVLLGVMAGVVFAQSRRWLEKVDLLIVAGLTLLLVCFFPASLLHRVVLLPPLSVIAQALGLGQPLLTILLIAGFAALVAIAATAIFRLIYNLISRLL
ncbi:MAG: protein kinase domain-containing protein [Elainella sp.]